MDSPPWTGLFHRLRGGIRHCLTSMAIATAGAVFLVAAAGFAVASGYLWLSMQVPSHLAALMVAGGLFLIGAIAVSVALSRNRGARQKPNAPDPTSTTDTEITTQRMMEAALVEVTKAPLAAAGAALALGVVVGLLRSKRSP